MVTVAAVKIKGTCIAATAVILLVRAVTAVSIIITVTVAAVVVVIVRAGAVTTHGAVTIPFAQIMAATAVWKNNYFSFFISPFIIGA